MSDRLSEATCQARLAALWFVGSGIVFGLILIQTLAGKYGARSDAVWAWLVPAIIPTLSLIVGAVAYNAARPRRELLVNRLAYRLALALSAFYLLLMLGTLLAEPLTRTTPLQLFDMSKLWLLPIQGLVSIALGAFFVSREEA